ncbi:Kelch-type beta propeller [Pelomyxa schiedti]|nr:Kelch-type beta propeller [Pelomyxa schiedti]
MSNQTSSVEPPVTQYSLKAVLAGSEQSGKTSLEHFFHFRKPLLDPQSTIGAAFRITRIMGPMGEIKFETWDPAGRNRTRNLMPMYYRGAAIGILVFALDDPLALDTVPEYFSEMYRRATPYAQVILVGTKLDLIGQRGPCTTPNARCVPYQKAVQMAKSIGALGYVELSNATGQNHECFLNLLVEAANMVLPKMYPQLSTSAALATAAQVTAPTKPGFFASLLSLVYSPKSTVALNCNSAASTQSGAKCPSWQGLFGQESRPAAHLRYGHVCEEHRGILYIFGGAGDINLTTTMRFDLKSAKWLAPLQCPTIGKFPAMVKEMYNLYLFGGEIGGIPTNDLFHFNFEAQEWTKLFPTEEGSRTNAPSPRYGASIIKHWDTLYIFGGSSGDAYFNDIKKFNLNSKKWEPSLPAESSLIPPPRCHHAAFKIRNKEAIFYLFGGLSEARAKLSDLWELCPTSPLTWKQHTTSGTSPTPQRGHVGCVADNSFLMFGSSNDNPNCEISQLDFDSLNWTRLSPTGTAPSAREFHAATYYDGKIIVFGGLLRQVSSDLLGDAFILSIPTVQSPSIPVVQSPSIPVVQSPSIPVVQSPSTPTLTLSAYCWAHICSFLPPESIARLGMCCKGLYALCNGDEIWRVLLPPELQTGPNLKNKYVELYVRKALWRNPTPKSVDTSILIETPQSVPSGGWGCFLGNGIVHLANCTTKYVSEIVPGDFILSESLNAREVSRVVTRDVNRDYNLVILNGLGLTTGHPVLVNGKWMHPTEITTPTRLFVTKLYNFELVGGSKVQDHSVIINGLVVCTLGKDCGQELNERFPVLNDKYGTGYWSKTPNNQSKA